MMGLRIAQNQFGEICLKQKIVLNSQKNQEKTFGMLK